MRFTIVGSADDFKREARSNWHSYHLAILIHKKNDKLIHSLSNAAFCGSELKLLIVSKKRDFVSEIADKVLTSFDGTAEVHRNIMLMCARNRGRKKRMMRVESVKDVALEAAHAC